MPALPQTVAADRVVLENSGLPMQYYPILILSVLASSLIPSAASAQSKEQTPPWVCSGYFEKTLDREEASHGIRVYHERFMAKKDGAVRRAVFVFPVAFRIMRDHLRSQTATRFGEASFAAYPALDLGQDVSAAAPAKHQPGDQLASLAGSGVKLESAAAVRIVTKPYTGVPSKNGWSELHRVALDGAGVVGIDSTLIVLWRQDSAEEWGTGASGSLLDFGKHRVSANFVTSSEFALMERLSKLYNTPFGLFPLSDSGPLAKDAASLQNARDWLAKYREKPDDKMQAARPGRC
jgi:hypothetical protein